ncbi:DUF3575 domain-containing protein [Puia dinghuensis]|uniref:DUF3575 domain-containing protein n=1 Tax=Puia dinghuensis TaxID=1792502 RepID=A0A8J2UAV7_9BACT|nr:DUF3575 domain-containing protein [Puia dinghuensis]GGA91673.1 hypothetical protein GCM10011511_13790 [Puia dinghuensis]
MKQLLFFCFLLSVCLAGRAQEDKLNDLKLNVTSLAINNYHLTYERALTHHVALGLGVRYMPKGSLPFEKQFKKSVKSDKVNFDEFQLGNFAVTPECRFYMGKGSMHGFYISVYGRYASFDVTAPIEYTTNSGTTETVLFDGKVNSYSGGVMFGMQYTLWKVVVLDIMLIGGHYGSCSGTINANNINPPLSAQDQQSLQNNINTINAKPFNITGQVISSTQAVIKASGPWGGIRSGINLGVRF